jgi:Carboxypeptidase regulatory-like domain
MMVSAGPSAAQTGGTRILSGVTADTMGHVVPYVTVWFAGTRRTVSDDSGRFRVELPRGGVTVDLRRLGFAPVDIRLEAGGDTVIAVALMPVAAKLTAMRVQAEQQVRSLELHGFYERMADREKWGGSGQFVTPEEIEFRKSPRTTQLLDDRLGVRVKGVGGCTVQVQCFVPLGTNNCIMQIYLNGQRLMPSGGARAQQRATGGMVATAFKALSGQAAAAGGLDPSNVVFLDDFVHPSELAGIEIYQRAVQAPPQYQTMNGNCGVVLVWTK